MSAVPDVSVVIPVYDTMPYLKACLDSLAAQTIGAGRLEVIAVDDGSTDGSGAELDRFAAAHPGLVRVVHQENSGGPAAPCNTGLDLARGRYVFFIGSDDYLGPEALERMVRRADELGSDVLLCKMVGVNGRKAPDVFAADVDDAEFPTPELAWALSNTKLFRRDLVEDEGLRFPLGMAVCSDVPFTLRAMAKAKRISILADYDCYFAVKRETGGNLIYSTGPVEWVAAAETIVETIEDLYGPGPGRDALIYRVFSREIAKCVQPELLAADPADRARFWDAVAGFCDAHLTEELRSQLPTEKRVRISLAQRREHALLEAAIAAAAPGFLTEAGRVFARYPGFRAGMPDEWYEAATERVTGRLAAGLAPIDLAWAGDKATGHYLEYWFRIPVEGLESAAVGVTAEPIGFEERPAPRRAVPTADFVPGGVAAEVEVRPDGDTAVVAARLPLGSLAGKRGRWSLRGVISLGPYVYDLPLKAVRGPVQRRGRPVGLSVDWGPKSKNLVVHSSGRPTLKRRVASLVGLDLSRK